MAISTRPRDNRGTLTRLGKAGTAVVFCDELHLPTAALVPLNATNGIGELVTAQYTSRNLAKAGLATTRSLQSSRTSCELKPVSG